MIQHRLELVEIGKRLYNRGLIVGGEGNISLRIAPDRLLTTPTGMCKGRMQTDDLVEVDLAGNSLHVYQKRPSSELPMHLAIYQAVPETQAIVHAHPITATGFALAHIPLDKCLLPEIVLTFGIIPLVDYGTPSTRELSAIVGDRIKGHKGLLLANHGVVTIGQDLEEAYNRMEMVEHYAKTVLVATILHGPQELTREQLQKLNSLQTANPTPYCQGV